MDGEYLLEILTKMNQGFLEDSLTFNNPALGVRTVPGGNGVGKCWLQQAVLFKQESISSAAQLLAR